MKRILFTLLTLGFAFYLHAQTVSEAKQFLQHDRYKSAEEVLTKLLSKDSLNPTAWDLLAEIYAFKKDSVIKDLLCRIPINAKSLPMIDCALGTKYLVENKKDSANIYFNQAISKTRGKDPVILRAIATANVEADQGDPHYAIDLLHKAIQKEKNNGELYLELGNACNRLHDGSGAFKAYRTATELESNNAKAFYKLGEIFKTQNNPDQYLIYFKKATMVDSTYAPAWYALYYYYYFRDIPRAMTCFQHYVAHSDADDGNNYLYTDLLYLDKKYDLAIKTANQLLKDVSGEKDSRLYKLIAYSYYALKDSAQAMKYFHDYFQYHADSTVSAKDLETMGTLYSLYRINYDSATGYFIQAANLEKDTTEKNNLYKKIAGLYHKSKDYKDETYWIGRYCRNSPQATNLDIFNWGLAEYLSQNYLSADSVFALYTAEHPEQTFGYYWRARSNSALDSNMEKGLAIPYYDSLIEIASKDSTNATNRKWVFEAYGYIGAYKANTLKDYDGAIVYFEKLLALDPENAQVKKYITILNKNISSKGVSETDK
jgi:tetratricopeptide (TPR) repeat protein